MHPLISHFFLQRRQKRPSKSTVRPPRRSGLYTSRNGTTAAAAAGAGDAVVRAVGVVVAVVEVVAVVDEAAPVVATSARRRVARRKPRQARSRRAISGNARSSRTVVPSLASVERASLPLRVRRRRRRMLIHRLRPGAERGACICGRMLSQSCTSVVAFSCTNITCLR